MRRVANELGMVLLALSLSVVVWIIAVQEEDPIEQNEFSQPIPIEVHSLPGGMMLLPVFDQEVTVTIRAPSSTWNNLRTDMFTAWVDLAGLVPGDHEMEIQVSCSDPDVVIVELVPVTVPVGLKKEMSREVPVQVRLHGSVASFFELKTDLVTIEPETVIVTGPESIIEQVRTATVDFYLDDSVKETIITSRSVVARQANGEFVGSFVTVEPSTVDIVIPVEQRTGFKEVAVRPRVVGVPAPGYRLRGVSVDPTTVTLGGDNDAVEAIIGYVENVPLDITDATSDVVERLALSLPEGASAVGVQGVLVTANIEPLPGRQTLSRVPIVQGLSTDLVAVISPERVSLILTGPLPRLNAITQDDVQVYVELVEKGVGQHNIELTYLVPEGLELESIVPVVVGVTISRITPTPMPTPTLTFTPTPTPTPTPTVTNTVSVTFAVTSTVTVTMPAVTLTPSGTPTASGTAAPNVHRSPLPTPTALPPVTPTIAPTPTRE